MAIAGDARNLFMLVRKGLDVRAIHAHVRKPFRFLLCGDPALVAELRGLLLFGHEDGVPLESAACLETVPVGAPLVTNPAEVRAVVFLGRRGDAAAADLSLLAALRAPMLAVTVDADAVPSSPSAAPAAGASCEYVVPALDARGAARTLLSASRRMRGRRRDRGRPASSRAARDRRCEADPRCREQRAQSCAGQRGRRSHSGRRFGAGRLCFGRRHGGDHRHSSHAHAAHRGGLRPRSRRAPYLAALADHRRRIRLAHAGARTRPASFRWRESRSRARSPTPARSSSAKASRSSWSKGIT